MTRVDRELPTSESRDLLALVADIAAAELTPHAASAEREGVFRRETLRLLGRAGLLGLPYPTEYGGGGQPYEVYLQVVEELGRAWASVALSVSVHTLACFPLARFGSDSQRDRWLPAMVSGDLLGAYSLSEPQSGSDAAALRTRAERGSDGRYVVNGTKAWVTHAGAADFYSLMVRTGGSGPSGVSCLLVDADTPGLEVAPHESKMGMQSSPTAGLVLDGVTVDPDRLLGEEGEGFAIAMAALDTGRLGIAAVAVGLAQAALDAAVDYAKTREQFGSPIIGFQGVSFMLADMATSVAAARSLYLTAARRKDRGQPFGTEAAMAKVFATDAAMRVTTDAVQVLGGYGYTTDYPLERYMREAKLLQIVEGTNQVQRLVIGRALGR